MISGRLALHDSLKEGCHTPPRLQTGVAVIFEMLQLLGQTTLSAAWCQNQIGLA